MLKKRRRSNIVTRLRMAVFVGYMRTFIYLSMCDMRLAKQRFELGVFYFVCSHIGHPSSNGSHMSSHVFIRQASKLEWLAHACDDAIKTWFFAQLVWKFEFGSLIGSSPLRLYEQAWFTPDWLSFMAFDQFLPQSFNKH
jgi:hypothetical protein